MAMRSAMGGTRDRLSAAGRREHQRHREYRALAGPGAVRADVATHAARELTCDRETETRAMSHAFTRAAIMDVEELLGGFGRKTTTAVADVQAPASVADARGEPNVSAAILVGVVEQVLE